MKVELADGRRMKSLTSSTEQIHTIQNRWTGKTWTGFCSFKFSNQNRVVSSSWTEMKFGNSLKICLNRRKFGFKRNEHGCAILDRGIYCVNICNIGNIGTTSGISADFWRLRQHCVHFLFGSKLCVLLCSHADWAPWFVFKCSTWLVPKRSGFHSNVIQFFTMNHFTFVLTCLFVNEFHL